MSGKKPLDPDKLTLGTKKPIVKNEPSKQPELLESAIKQIHEKQEGRVETAKQADHEPTTRTTLDIPRSLHKEIKRKLIDKGVTIKDYFLDLAKKDLGLQ
jgi:hypothetical protein